MHRSTETAVRTLMATILELLDGDDEEGEQPEWERDLRELARQIGVERDRPGLRAWRREPVVDWPTYGYGAAILTTQAMTFASFDLLRSVNVKADRTLKSKCPLCEQDLSLTVDRVERRLSLQCPNRCGLDSDPMRAKKWQFSTALEEDR